MTTFLASTIVGSLGVLVCSKIGRSPKTQWLGLVPGLAVGLIGIIKKWIKLVIGFLQNTDLESSI